MQSSTAFEFFACDVAEIPVRSISTQAPPHPHLMIAQLVYSRSIPDRSPRPLKFLAISRSVLFTTSLERRV